MRELFLSYIGSPWFFSENSPMNVMGPINIVSMLAMAFLNMVILVDGMLLASWTTHWTMMRL